MPPDCNVVITCRAEGNSTEIMSYFTILSSKYPVGMCHLDEITADERNGRWLTSLVVVKVRTDRRV